LWQVEVVIVNGHDLDFDIFSVPPAYDCLLCGTRVSQALVAAQNVPPCPAVATAPTPPVGQQLPLPLGATGAGSLPSSLCTTCGQYPKAILSPQCLSCMVGAVPMPQPVPGVGTAIGSAILGAYYGNQPALGIPGPVVLRDDEADNVDGHDWERHPTTDTRICTRCEYQVSTERWMNGEYVYTCNVLEAAPAGKPTCTACRREMSEALDAYYGRDPVEAAKCADCRHGRKHDYSPLRY
jgi:hypothetical protein